MSDDEENDSKTPGRTERRLRLVQPNEPNEPRGDHESHDPSPEGPNKTPQWMAEGPFPDPRTAFWLTVGGVFGTGFIGVFFFGLGLLPAIGIGHAIAVGTLASVAAQRVPEPQTERMGLRGFDLSALPMVLCLAPAVLVASELDNFAYDWSGGSATTQEERLDASAAGSFDPLEAYNAFGTGSEVGVEAVGDEAPTIGEPRGSETAEADAALAEGEGDETAAEARAREIAIDPTDPLTIAQAFVISAGIAPLVDEFFFRGVIQQSMVARFGLMRGVAFVAMLYTLFHFPAFAEFPRLIVGVFSSFGFGMILGLVRAATGSILAPILLASLWSAIGIASMALRDRMPLPGMNIEGTHLPILVAGLSFAIVAWALNEVFSEAEKRESESSFD